MNIAQKINEIDQYQMKIWIASRAIEKELEEMSSEWHLTRSIQDLCNSIETITGVIGIQLKEKEII